MHNLKVGTTVLILDASGLWHVGKKAQLMSIAETRVTVEVNGISSRPDPCLVSMREIVANITNK